MFERLRTQLLYCIGTCTNPALLYTDHIRNNLLMYIIFTMCVLLVNRDGPRGSKIPPHTHSMFVPELVTDGPNRQNPPPPPDLVKTPILRPRFGHNWTKNVSV